MLRIYLPLFMGFKKRTSFDTAPTVGHPHPKTSRRRYLFHGPRTTSVHNVGSSLSLHGVLRITASDNADEHTEGEAAENDVTKGSRQKKCPDYVLGLAPSVRRPCLPPQVDVFCQRYGVAVT